MGVTIIPDKLIEQMRMIFCRMGTIHMERIENAFGDLLKRLPMFQLPEEELRNKVKTAREVHEGAVILYLSSRNTNNLRRAKSPYCRTSTKIPLSPF